MALALGCCARDGHSHRTATSGHTSERQACVMSSWATRSTYASALENCLIRSTPMSSNGAARRPRPRVSRPPFHRRGRQQQHDQPRLAESCKRAPAAPQRRPPKEGHAHTHVRTAAPPDPPPEPHRGSAEAALYTRRAPNLLPRAASVGAALTVGAAGPPSAPPLQFLGASPASCLPWRPPAPRHCVLTPEFLKSLLRLRLALRQALDDSPMSACPPAGTCSGRAFPKPARTIAASSEGRSILSPCGASRSVRWTGILWTRASRTRSTLPLAPTTSGARELGAPGAPGALEWSGIGAIVSCIATGLQVSLLGSPSRPSLPLRSAPPPQVQPRTTQR